LPEDTELDLRPVDGLARWLPPVLFRGFFGALSMREQPRHLRSGFLSPEAGFFRRDRYLQPTLDPERWALRIRGVSHPGSLTLDGLAALPQHELVCVMECAGNGNHWQGSAGLIGQRRWRGPRVVDVLESLGGSAGPGGLGGKQHFVFRGADGLRKGPSGYHYGLSLAELRTSGALVATHCDGAPLTRARGFPARLVVPGIYSMSYVKWLAEIEGLDAHHDGIYNRLIYANKRRVGGRWQREEARWVGLKSQLTRCVRHPDGWELHGWAWGGGKRIASVRVTTDGGESWQEADVHQPDVHFARAAETSSADASSAETCSPDTTHAWAVFRYLWRAPTPGRHRVTCRAWAQDGSVQPLRQPEDVRGHYDQTRVKWRRVKVPSGR
jgi:sulfane dehydrogenase subunit SoxC